LSEHKPLISFQPVPVRYRYDGWTAEKQIAFIEKLADCGSVSAAAKHVGMSRESARKLRRRPLGCAYAHACARALRSKLSKLPAEAAERKTVTRDKPDVTSVVSRCARTPFATRHLSRCSGDALHLRRCAWWLANVPYLFSSNKRGTRDSHQAGRGRF
jgi:hypothetical protein